jgi:hypothetical protein
MNLKIKIKSFNGVVLKWCADSYFPSSSKKYKTPYPKASLPPDSLSPSSPPKWLPNHY